MKYPASDEAARRALPYLAVSHLRAVRLGANPKRAQDVGGELLRVRLFEYLFRRYTRQLDSVLEVADEQQPQVLESTLELSPHLPALQQQLGVPRENLAGQLFEDGVGLRYRLLYGFRILAGEDGSEFSPRRGIGLRQQVELMLEDVGNVDTL